MTDVNSPARREQQDYAALLFRPLVEDGTFGCTVTEWSELHDGTPYLTTLLVSRRDTVQQIWTDRMGPAIGAARAAPRRHAWSAEVIHRLHAGQPYPEPVAHFICRERHTSAADQKVVHVHGSAVPALATFIRSVGERPHVGVRFSHTCASGVPVIRRQIVAVRQADETHFTLRTFTLSPAAEWDLQAHCVVEAEACRDLLRHVGAAEIRRPNEVQATLFSDVWALLDDAWERRSADDLDMQVTFGCNTAIHFSSQGPLHTRDAGTALPGDEAARPARRTELQIRQEGAAIDTSSAMVPLHPDVGLVLLRVLQAWTEGEDCTLRVLYRAGACAGTTLTVSPPGEQPHFPLQVKLPNGRTVKFALGRATTLQTLVHVTRAYLHGVTPLTAQVNL